MSDYLTPTLQNPTMCDFGPFAGAACGKVITLDFKQAGLQISAADLTIELLENASANISLEDLVNSVTPINWSKTEFIGVTGGVVNFDPILAKLVFTPDQTPSVDRTVSFTFKVFNELNYEATGTITINILDRTPELSVGSFTLSGTEAQIFNIDIKTKVTVKNTEVDYSDVKAVTLVGSLSEGKVSISNGIITFTPSEEPSDNRTVTFKYKVKDISGLEAEGNISIALQDVSPALTVNTFSKNVLDTATLTSSILSNIVIKNDSFKTLTFDTPAEGTFTVSGSNYTFTPGNVLKKDRTITINYTVETQSGIIKSAKMTIIIKYDNIWAGTFWHGNNTNDKLVKSEIETLTSTKKTGYAGTYSIPAGTGTFKWFVYPKIWGENPTVLDASNNMPIALEDNQYLTVEGIDLVLLRSYYTLNGAITIKFS